MKNLVVVTGRNSGLGQELTKLFSEAGYNVLVIARTPRAELVGGGVFCEYGNLVDEEFLKAVYQKYSTYKLKFLINCAGVGRFGSPEENKLSKIQEVLQSNLAGLILNTTYALPLMKDEGGKIVNILSTAALKGNTNESLYCAAKWGARGYTESLKVTYKNTNIKVIGVYPGGMDTKFWDNNRNYVSIEKSSKWMNPSHVAKVIYENITNNNLCVADLVIERV